MSRRLVLFVTAMSISAQQAAAQNGPPVDVAAIIKKNEKMLENLGKCPEPEEGEEIVVCAAPEQEREKFEDDNPNRVHRGEAVSGRSAAACISGPPACPPRLAPLVTSSFGYVPPWPPMYEDAVKGLADPENVVKEGSVDAQGRPVDEAPVPAPAPNP